MEKRNCVTEVQRKDIAKKRYNSLAWLRAIATIMIVYDHLAGMRNPEWVTNKIVDNIICRPLNIIQSFGAFGVSLFYLISGFLLMNSNVSDKSEGKTALMKIGRIYLSSLVAFAGFGLCIWGLDHFIDTYWSQYKIEDWLLSASLIGYFKGTGEVINGTTWFMLPLFLFYVLGVWLRKDMERNYTRSFLKVECFCTFLLLGLILGKRIFQVEVPISGYFPFVFIPLTGVLFYGIFVQKVRLWRGVMLFIVNYGLLVIALKELNYGYYEENPYLISYIYGCSLFLLFLIGEHHFNSNKALGIANKLGLPIYLLHMTWGSLCMTFLEGKIPFGVSLLLSVSVVVGLAWIHERFVDRKLAKWLK